jgi:Arc/MetJ-type ribon-helix-helix transcriptional regulator
MRKDNVRELRPRGSESEKITINLGHVDLGQIDLLVDEGFYSNRTDFIRTAIRNQIERHAEVVNKAVTRQSLELGLRLLDRDELEATRANGEQLDLRVLGLLTIASDVSAKLARATIASLTVLGTLHASTEVRAALVDRIR